MQPVYPSNVAYCKKDLTIIEVGSTGIDWSAHINHFIKFVPKELCFLFSFEEYLGSGTFGDVFKVQRKRDKTTHAIKLIDSYDASTNAELKILRKLKHKYIIDFKEVIETDGVLAIVMELADSSLDKKIRSGKPLTEKEILNYFLQICEGLQYIHENKIIHRDLKPNNILLQATCVKIADFGISKEVKKDSDITHSQLFQGSKKYSAPEFYKCEPHYDISIDNYSLGKILEEMLKHSKIAIDDYKEIIASIS